MRRIVSLLTVLLLFCAVAFAQTRVVSGTVRDDKGAPVPFATVTETGTKNATKADENGNFTITVRQGSTLTITSSGFTSTSLTPGAGRQVVVMAPSTSTVQEVVVTTALGIRRQAREVGFSTATVSGQDISQTKPINPAVGLTGKVSGLQIQTTDNGVNPQVRVTLRGNRSILGNNQALIIVDGIQVDNDYLARINANDIESMNVLKGASASAIYGSNASNGVIVVTTKKGSRGGRPRIVFSSTAQMQSVSYMPKLQDRFGSYGGEGFNDNLAVHFAEDPIHVYYPYENQSYGPEYNGQLAPIGGPVRIYRPDGTYFDSTRMIPYAAVKNGKRDFFDKAMTYQNNVSFSTGDNQGTFYMSYQNVASNGIVPGDKSARNSIRVNGTREYGRFKMEYNTYYALEKIDQAGGSYFQDRPVYWTVINAPQHVNLRDYRNWQTDPFASPDWYFNAYYGNPWWQIDQSRQVTQNNNFIGDLKFSLDITSWLNASYTVGYSRNDQDYKTTKAGINFDPYAQTDPWEAGAIPSSVRKLDPSMSGSLSWTKRLSGTGLLNFHKDFGPISTKLIVGNDMYKRTYRYISEATSTLVIPGIYNINYRQGEPSVGEGIFNEGLIGVFGDLTLGFNNYLFLHASGRNDWNSKLAEANRSYFYPAVDASFVFTDAIPALKNNNTLSYGKIRAAVSRVGQVSVGPYSLDNLVFPGGGFPYGSQVGFTISNNFANPGLKPEFTTEKEVGIELGFLKNRANFQVALFDTKTTNQTIPAQISPATGFTSATINLGSMTNRGVEVDLRMTPLLDLGPVKWNFGANFAYIKNTVGQDLGGEISLGNSVYAIPGLPYPYVKATDWVRDPQGHIVVDANTGFPTKASPLVPLGTTVPPYKVGLTSSFTFKGLTLSAVADARFGAVIYNGLGPSLDFTGISWYTASAGRQPFVLPNSVIQTAPDKYVPNTNVVTNTFYTSGEWRFWANTWNAVGSNYVNSADFWKIREISLNYDFPKSLTDKLRIVQGASLTLSGRNLFMFRAKDNIWTDPEFSAAGTGNAIGGTNEYQTPPTRTYGATLNVTF